MKIKVEIAKGPVLDWLAARADGLNPSIFFGREGEVRIYTGAINYAPSSNASQGNAIIVRKGIETHPDDPVMPKAIYVPNPVENPHFWFRQYGETILIAAMRVHVASELGDEVDVPARLVKNMLKKSGFRI